MGSLKINLLTVSVILAAAAFSCVRKDGTGVRLSPFASELLVDTSQVDFKILSRAEAPVKSYISVVGEPRQSLLLTEYLLGCDLFDNIDGRLGRDFLPDFSGEVFAPMLDLTENSYADIFSAHGRDSLADHSLKALLPAIDSLAYLSVYDKVGLLRKSPSKMVVMSSSLASASLSKELDSLLAVSGSKVRIISSARAALDFAAERHGRSCSVAVWSGKTETEQDVWGTLASASASTSLKVHSFCTDTLPSVARGLRAFLDDFAVQASGEKLSALILDDIDVVPDSLSHEISCILALADERDLTYRNLLAEDFELIEQPVALAYDCYKYLRSHNGFTHKVSYPELSAYVLLSGVDGRLKPVRNKDKYLSQDLKDFMQTRTPLFVEKDVR